MIKINYILVSHNLYLFHFKQSYFSRIEILKYQIFNIFTKFLPKQLEKMEIICSQKNIDLNNIKLASIIQNILDFDSYIFTILYNLEPFCNSSIISWKSMSEARILGTKISNIGPILSRSC